MEVRYYDVQRNWSKKIKPLLTDRAVTETLHEDFGKFTVSRCGELFRTGSVPADYETCDWKCSRRGKHPAFWDYVRHSACHWLVNLNLRLATRVEPKREWRILTSDLHSTVFDGKDTLFDMNFLALGIKSGDAYERATRRSADSRRLPVGNELETHYFGPLVPSIAERALLAMKGHPDYYEYLEACYEETTYPKKGNTGITLAELEAILNKLKKGESVDGR